MDGWVKFHRKILEWEWYRDSHTLRVFIHLILTANINDVRYMGMQVPRGSLVLRIQSDKGDSLCSALGITPREARTAIERLVKTGEITKKTTNKFTLINIVNYSVYQDLDNDKRQTNDKQTTIKRQTNDKLTTSIEEEEKEGKKERRKRNIDMSNDISPVGYRQRYTPEQLKIIDEFFDVLKYTRRGSRLAEGVVMKIYQNWEIHEVQKVIYALHKYIHNPSLHDKKESYVLGIIRNTTAEDIAQYKNSMKSTAHKTVPQKKGRFVNFEQPDDWNFEKIQELDTAKNVFDIDIGAATTEAERIAAVEKYNAECEEIGKKYGLQNHKAGEI